MSNNLSNNKSVILWKGRLITQFAYTTNFILLLAIVGLSLEAVLILNEKIQQTHILGCLFLVSLISFSISIFTGVLIIIIRLHNLRITNKIVRKRESGAISNELKIMRKKSNKYSKQAWILFWVQSISFLMALLVLISITGNILFNKIF